MSIFKTMKDETYLDVTTLINTIRELALKDLGLKNETTPYIIDDKLNVHCYGRTVHSTDSYIQYVGINQNQGIKCMIETIFHESRHVYQIRRYKRYMERLTIKNILYGGPKSFAAYYWQPIEVGARIYARFAMIKHRKQINKIIDKYINKTLDEKLS